MTLGARNEGERLLDGTPTPEGGKADAIKMESFVLQNLLDTEQDQILENSLSGKSLI